MKNCIIFLVALIINFYFNASSNGQTTSTEDPKLLQPANGAELDNGCSDQSDNKIWEFDWEDVMGAQKYHLYVKGSNAIYPAIDNNIIKFN